MGCSNGDVAKLDSLFAECPFKNDSKKSSRYHENIDKDNNESNEVVSYLEYDNYDDDIIQHMEWLLQACVPKSNLKGTQNERDARQKLATFIMSMCVEVIFQPFRNGRNALHVACQLGDVQFVKTVVEHVNAAGNDKNPNSEEEKNSLTLYLDWLCEESGWSPLHYATAAGSMEVIDILLAGGSSVKILTDPSLTCKVSNFKGVSAYELAQSIQNGTWKTQIVCHGNALKKAASSEKSLDDLVTHLKDIEINGYIPWNPDSPSTDLDTSYKKGKDVKQGRDSLSDEFDSEKNPQHKKPIIR